MQGFRDWPANLLASSARCTCTCRIFSNSEFSHRIHLRNTPVELGRLGSTRFLRVATSLRFEIDQLTANAHVQSKINLKNSQKTVQKHISSLKTRIYPQRFPNASAVAWSLVLQTSLTKFTNSRSVMILVVRLAQLTDTRCSMSHTTWNSRRVHGITGPCSLRAGSSQISAP
jgi:hypothetical protein